MKRLTILIALAFVLSLGAALDPAAAQDKKTLHVVMHSGLRITDPIAFTAYITRDHGYMIYDTLFAMDEKFEIKPQMVKDWKVSDDKLTYTFTLRDGLKFQDGRPVRAADCVASLQRWAKRDVTRPKAVLLMHFFNHQTHHRGQVHCMLTQAGKKAHVTDLPYMPA